MAKPSAPLLSFGARGTIAKTAVYSSWRGVPYVRQHVVPANPRTTAQVANRAVFSWMQAVWKVSQGGFQTAWTAFVMGRPLTNRNAWLQKNAVTLEGGTSLVDLIWSPGANAGIALVSVTPTPSMTSVSFAFVAPTPPAGWTLDTVVIDMLLQQDPHVGTTYTMHENSASGSPIVVTGLVAATVYAWGGFPVWLKPDSSLAYGASIGGLVTTT